MLFWDSETVRTGKWDRGDGALNSPPPEGWREAPGWFTN
jgi:hypothetical protein